MADDEDDLCDFLAEFEEEVHAPAKARMDKLRSSPCHTDKILISAKNTAPTYVVQSNGLPVRTARSEPAAAAAAEEESDDEEAGAPTQQPQSSRPRPAAIPAIPLPEKSAGAANEGGQLTARYKSDPAAGAAGLAQLIEESPATARQVQRS